ncbi:MAG TPA: hypothetical protein VEI97_04655 [bacterium]|nr:hypothetical protein [bacterium]
MVQRDAPNPFFRYLRISAGLLAIAIWIYGLVGGHSWATRPVILWLTLIGWLFGGGGEKEETPARTGTAAVHYTNDGDDEDDAAYTLADFQEVRQHWAQMTPGEQRSLLQTIHQLPPEQRFQALAGLRHSTAPSGTASGRPAFAQEFHLQSPDLFTRPVGGATAASSAMLGAAVAQNRAQIEALHRAIPPSRTAETLHASSSPTMAELKSRPSAALALLRAERRSQRMLRVPSQGQQRIQRALARQLRATDRALTPLRAPSAKVRPDGTLSAPLPDLRTPQPRFIRG